jgi:hypothetical protein
MINTKYHVYLSFPNAQSWILYNRTFAGRTHEQVALKMAQILSNIAATNYNYILVRRLTDKHKETLDDKRYIPTFFNAKGFSNVKVREYSATPLKKKSTKKGRVISKRKPNH